MLHALQGSVGQGASGLLGVTKAEGEEAPPRGGAVRFRRGPGTANEARRHFGAGRSHLARGVERSLGSRSRAFGRGGVFRPSGLGGSRIRGAEGESSRGAETQESSDCFVRGNLGRVRTDSQGEEGFEAGEVGGMRPLRCSRPRATGKRSFLFVEREPIVFGGTRQLRESVGVGETGSDKVSNGGSLSVGG